MNKKRLDTASSTLAVLVRKFSIHLLSVARDLWPAPPGRVTSPAVVSPALIAPVRCPDPEANEKDPPGGAMRLKFLKVLVPLT